jgi:hypothetical protein
MNKIKQFVKKITLTSSDYKGLYSKKGVTDLLKGYGYPVFENEINDENWEEVYDLLIEKSL